MPPEERRILSADERAFKESIGNMLEEVFMRCHDELQKKGDKTGTARIHRVRNEIAKALSQKHPSHLPDEFLAYDFLIGSTERTCNVEKDFPEPGAGTVLKEVVHALEIGRLKPNPEGIIRWVRKRLGLSPAR